MTPSGLAGLALSDPNPLCLNKVGHDRHSRACHVHSAAMMHSDSLLRGCAIPPVSGRAMKRFIKAPPPLRADSYRERFGTHGKRYCRTMRFRNGWAMTPTTGTLR